MKTQRTNRMPLVAGVFLASAASFSAMALDGPTSLETLVDEADLVFHGVVEQIEYRLSNPGGPERRRIPYTFVTYRVNQVLHGEADGDLITLRFIGGLNEETGRYLQTSHSPQFDLDDEDVLFVQQNGARLIPLVDNLSGRLRVIDGQIYDENAHAVTIDDDGAINLGSRYLLEEAATTRVNGKLMHRDLGPEAKFGESDAMLFADLLHEVLGFAEQAPQPQQAFASADMDQPVAAPDMRPAPPPAMSAQERLEEQGAGSGEAGEPAQVQPPVIPSRKD